MNAKEANPGSYVLHKKEPYRVLKNESISVGTHSHSKTKLTLQSLESGKTEVMAVSHHENLQEAEVSRGKAQIMAVNKEKNEAQAMNMETYETITVHFPDKMSDDIEENGTIAYIEYDNKCTVTEARRSRQQN